MRCRLIAASLLFAASAARAQAPIVTRNADEPARNPYQEAQLTSCTDPGDCQVVFASVPPSTRRVVDYVNCEVDLVASGALIGVNLGTQTPKLARASLSFTAIPGLPTRSIVNSGTRLYFDVNDRPSVDVYTTGSGVSFLLCTLTGYNVTLP